MRDMPAAVQRSGGKAASRPDAGIGWARAAELAPSEIARRAVENEMRKGRVMTLVVEQRVVIITSAGLRR